MNVNRSIAPAGACRGRPRRPFRAAVDLAVICRFAELQPVAGTRPRQGLTAAVEQDALVVSWAGQNGADLRARYAIDGGQPVVRDLAVKKAGGQWTTLGKNLAPEYHVVSGIRRMADDQANPLKAAGIELTEEVINKNRWYAFWDAPLVMPGSQEMKDEAAWRALSTGRQRAGGAAAAARLRTPTR